MTPGVETEQRGSTLSLDDSNNNQKKVHFFHWTTVYQVLERERAEEEGEKQRQRGMGVRERQKERERGASEWKRTGEIMFLQASGI